MTSTDLAALRTLVDRAGVTSIYCSCYGCRAIAPLVPAAREALERLGQPRYAQHVCTHDGHITVTQPLPARGSVIQGDAAETTLEGRDE